MGNPVHDLRARLADAGFYPVGLYGVEVERTDGNEPIDPKSRGKVPWGHGWQSATWPAPALNAPDHVSNTGILATGLRIFDLDIDDGELVGKLRAAAQKLFGETIIRTRPGSSRCALIYRAAEGTPPKRVLTGEKGKVEVLGKGQQLHAFGPHYTGQPLVWFPEAPGDIEVSSLPAITETQIEEFFSLAAPALGAKPKTNGAGAHAPSRHGLTANILDIAAALRAIPNDGAPDWEAWNRVGMALWAATQGGEAGRELWHEWSIQHPAYDSTATDERWVHYRTSPPTQIGAGSLFHFARDTHRARSDKQDTADRDTHEKDVPQTDNDLFKLTFFSDIQEQLDAEDFIQGLLTKGAASVVYGESNAGKTFWATDLALHVAAGRQWNGRRIDQQGVIYVVLEGSIGFRNRVAAWKREYCDVSTIPFAAIQSAVNLLNPDADTPKLIATVKDASAHLGMRVGLIIIDTLSRALAGGNENSPEDMGALVRNMDRLREQTSAHVMFIHHSGKDAAKGARGHSLLRAAIDTEIEVAAEKETSRKTASVEKQRELQKGSVFEFCLDVVDLGQNRHGEAVTTCIVRHSGHGNAERIERGLKGHQGRAYEVLVDLIAERGESGFRGAPEGFHSVPADWWRDRFYDRAMPGDKQDTKRRAFVRAAETLVESRKVGMNNNRVWIVRKSSKSTFTDV